jgi:hypothetical protein
MNWIKSESRWFHYTEIKIASNENVLADHSNFRFIAFYFSYDVQ